MIRPSGARPAVALAISIIALGALATPVTAGPGTTTRWVDDDGNAGPTGCGGSATAKSKIQAAVNASDVNDVVIVCPGTYEEDVLIQGARNGLTIRGFSKWTAVVRAPDNAEDALILVDDVDRVTIQGLQLVFPTTGCEPASDELDGIEGVDANRLTVRGNHLRAAGEDTLGDCGYADGIEVTSSNSVLVHSNLIRDIQSDGVRWDETTGTVTGNSIRFYHLGEPDDGINEGDEGIDIEQGRATVTSNVVRSIPGGGDSGPNLGTGIFVDSAPGSIVRDNTVVRAFFGTEVSSGDTQVRNNEFRGFGEGPGIYVTGGNGSVIRNNLVRNFENGIHATVGGNVFRDNDSATNDDLDCLDDTSGGGTDGTDNTWVDNLGHPADPDGICDQLT